MPKIVSEETILEAALATILDYGYEGATTRLIAAKAQINEVTLFRRFGSKDKLVVLAVKQELAAFQAAHIEYTGDLPADLEQIVHFYATFFSQRAKLIPIIMSEVPRRPELRAGLHELVSIFQHLSAIITRYQATGSLRQEPPLQTLTHLLAPVLAHYLMQSLDLGANTSFNVTAYIMAFLSGHKVPSTE